MRSDALYPLSSPQQAVWVEQQLAPDLSCYNIGVAFRIEGHLDVDRFEAAIRETVERHEALRTVLERQDTGCMQRFAVDLDGAAPVLARIDVSTHEDPEAAAWAQIRGTFAAPFSLYDGSRLWAISWIQTGPGRGYWMMCFHHIIADGVSVGVFVHAVTAAYNRLGRGEPAPEADGRASYISFIEKEIEYHNSTRFADDRAFWSDRFARAPEPLFEAASGRRGRPGRWFGQVVWKLERQAFVRLCEVATALGGSSTSFLMAAIATYFGRVQGREGEVVIGMPTYNRSGAAERRTIGMFSTALPIAVPVDFARSFAQTLQAVGAELKRCYRHHRFPLAETHRQLGGGAGGRRGLFDISLSMESFPGDLPFDDDLRALAFPLYNGYEPHPLGIYVRDYQKNEPVHVELNFDPEVISPEEMARHLGQLERFTLAAIDAPDTTLAELPLLDAAEKRRLVEGFNETRRDYAAAAGVHELFERQAAATPERTAVELGAERVSYRELNERANQLAEHLRGMGVRPDGRVAICLERRVEMVVAILAALKAGAAYVPLDPAAPDARLAQMVRDSGPVAVLTQRSLAGRLPSEAAVVVVDDPSTAAAWAEGTRENVAAAALGLEAGHLAYVIYTSGSTGTPKGVAMPHGALVNLLGWHREELPAAARTLQFAALGFDVAFQEIFSTLTSGSTLVLVGEALRQDLPALARWVDEAKIERVFVPYIALSALCELWAEGGAELSQLRDVITAGEQLRITPAIRRALGGKARLHNHYGPTESHVVTAQVLEGEAGRWADLPPIGKPIGNARIYVLDGQRQPVPVGIAGELWIAGAPVARGYLGRPELTAERFAEDPFVAGGRMYKTGDLARWREDGALEYLGRNDFQVKIRGVRIELGEIEAQLSRVAGVREAAVLAREDVPGERRLVAYVVGDGGVSPESLRAELSERLPDAMVPAAYVLLDALPLSANGKLDRKALPAPEGGAFLRRDFAAPQGPIEIALAEIWGELLGLPQVGRHDNFFELGGHSLLGVRVVSHLRERLNIELPLAELFVHPVLAKLAEAVAAAAQVAPSAITPADRSQPTPLSPAQQRLWFIASVDERASAAYHISGALRLRGPLDTAALQAALDRIALRHEALRTRFVAVDGQPYQVVDAPRPFALAFEDAAGLDDRALEQRCAEAADEPFDLIAGPPIRGRLLRVGPEDHVLLLVMHHIVSDGWSVGVLVRELSALYDAFHRGEADPLPPLALQYADHTMWQWQWLETPAAQQLLADWVQELRGAPGWLELPTDRPRPPLQDYRGATIEVAFDAGLSQAVRELALRHGATPYMAVLAALAAVVARLSGQQQLVIGSAYAGRDRLETEPLIGFFVGTQALRIDVGSAADAAALLAQVRRATLAAQERQGVPFERLVEALNPSRSLAHHPVFQLMLSWLNTPEVAPTLSGLTAERLTSLPGSAQVDLAIDLEERGERIAGSLNFATALFDEATVRRLWAYLVAMLRGMAADDRRPLDRIPLLDEAERARALAMGDGGEATPAATRAHALFERQVALQPEAIALEHDGARLTYGELNARANQLAHHLRELGVKPDSRVAIFHERGLDMIVAVLATLKAGGAYVPLDPAYPDARLAYMLTDSAAVAVLTQRALRDRLPAACVAVLLDEPEGGGAPPWAAAPAQNLTIAETSAHLAYVIYTSGSTGTPKGVMVEHRQLCLQIASLGALYGLSPADRVLQFLGLSFDVAAEEIFGALSHGAALVLRTDEWLTEPPRWCELCEAHQLTLVNLSTMFWQRLAQDATAVIPTCLRQIVIGGASVGAAALEAWWQRPGYRPALANAYGATEATINSTVARCAPGDGALHVGPPIANARVYVLDGHREPVPMGVIGEIWIGGPMVARGYMNRPELTADRFIPDPFTGARMYRTGDLGRWRADGALEFLGRNDFQVKIRGFRVELGEIEAELERIDGIAEAAVTVRSDGPGEPRLVAYFVAAAGAATPDPAALRSKLAERLPEHMVPTAYVAMDVFPQTANGKLDRAALPAPQDDAYTRAEYAAPIGATEELLAQLWCELLGVERVSRDDDFFALGGHSLLAVRMTSRLRERLGVELPLTALFAHPRLSELAQGVAAAEQSALAALEAVDRSAPLPLSFSQQRLWFVNQIDPQAATAYHIPGVLRLRGPLDRGALQGAIDRIVERHEALRTRFVVERGQPRQVVDAPRGLALRFEDHSGIGDAELARLCRDELVTPFDLEGQPPIRGRLLRLGADDHLLLVTMHHIVSDGWSLSVLAHELSALYRAFRRGQADPLPPLSIQYGDYAAWQRRWLDGPVLREHLAYWVDGLRDAPELLALPTDRPRPAQQDYRGATLELSLDAQLSAALRAMAHRHGTTLYMTVLAAWAAVLSRWSGQTQVVIGSTVAGRDRAELEPLIGFFVNAQALRFDLEGSPDVRALLAQARRVALAAQEHRDVPFEQVVEALNPARSMAYNPVYQVRLAWQNTPETRLDLDGLTLDVVASAAGTAQFDLSLDLEDRDGRISGQLNYATALFDEATVRRHAAHLEAMLRGMAEDDGRAIDRVPLLGEAERELVLRRFNDTGRAWPSDETIHGLFERCAAARPDELAIACEDERLSYAALNARANRLAHHLRGLGVRPDSRVAICAERSVDMAVAMFATLKAGGAFVPLDPVHPDSRLAEMLEDCAPVALLTQRKLAGRLRPPAQCAVLVLDERPASEAAWAGASAQNPDPVEVGLGAAHLAYVIYTSGSTGVPKGVMVEHRNVLTFLRGLEERIHGPAPDCRRVAWNSSFGFDMAVKAWGQLCMGRSVYLVPERVRLDGEALLDFLERHAIEAIEGTPSHLRMLQAAGFPGRRGRSLRKVLLGGEAIDAALWRALVAAPGIAFHNMYGPTECSVDATCGPIAGEAPHIGTVMPGARIYILDAHRAPAPMGALGEIWIGGAGVARGYLHRPSLTAERFVEDPFAGSPEARMYRTGDLGRWRSDGTVEYAGRNDFQVKIRGFRIELGEIEARLAALGGVRRAVVIVRDDGLGDGPGEPRMVAYVVPEAGAQLDPAALRAQLSAELPDYMLPAAFVMLEALPLNAHGKLDRAALPVPDGAAAARRKYEPPAEGAERMLAELWSELLGVEQVSRHDNFFELGGHSALAIALIHRMSELQLEVDVQMIFNAPTLADLAAATVQLEEVVL